MVCVEPNSEKIVLSNLKILADFKILSNPDVWITDTGATIQNSLHSYGLIKSRNLDSNDSVTVGNGEKWH